MLVRYGLFCCWRKGSPPMRYVWQSNLKGESNTRVILLIFGLGAELQPRWPPEPTRKFLRRKTWINWHPDSLLLFYSFSKWVHPLRFITSRVCLVRAFPPRNPQVVSIWQGRPVIPSMAQKLLGSARSFRCQYIQKTKGYTETIDAEYANLLEMCFSCTQSQP